ncbi:hypothetical protein L1987_79252 [Smallanthus sonchifolius]|uniref:Uncharacterized protein n=1 Tax=Smallanthus sonchifolius TaxID=185202 RepID=A0ACB8ZFH9_9ASTR|nr:hypothetical protein L1987_79252 [Smallanthus sonchifolius]
MGLQNQLTDVSSDSLPLFLLAIIADAVSYLRSLIFTLLYSLGFTRYRSGDADDSGLFEAVGSGLAELVILADQLNLNRVLSYKYSSCTERCVDPAESECVVCLNRLADGEHVRKLPCRHVFHKDCFDGWLDHLNFNCPLCRLPLVSDERVVMTRRRMTDDVMNCMYLTLEKVYVSLDLKIPALEKLFLPVSRFLFLPRVFTGKC